MSTLLDKFRTMDSSLWHYPYYNFRQTNPFEVLDNDNFKTFIEQYFRNSGKEIFHHDLHELFGLQNNRAIHTVFVFFLGLLIFNGTKFDLLLYHKEYDKKGNPRFPFVWFLSILFHDYAEDFESKSIDLDRYKDMDSIYNELKIVHKILKRKKIDQKHDKLFSLIRNYFSFRRYGMKQIDHGILAGIYFYDRLIKNRIINKKRLGNENPNSWNVGLNDIYATAAAAIACHNIWTTTKYSETHSDYIKFELAELIQPNFPTIKSEEHPLLFLFGLVDTIDPFKYFYRRGFNLQSILERLDIDFSHDNIRIKNMGIEPKEFEGYKNDMIKNFKGWLNLEVTSEDLTSFSITF